jgi:hypothetical protein
MRLLTLLLLITSQAHAADPALRQAIVMCESSGKHLNRQGKMRCGKDSDEFGESCGIAQFKQATFYEFATEAKIEGSWPFKRPRWTDKEQQLWLLNWGLDHQKGERWSCYRKLTQPMD